VRKKKGRSKTLFFSLRTGGGGRNKKLLASQKEGEKRKKKREKKKKPHLIIIKIERCRSAEKERKGLQKKGGEQYFLSLLFSWAAGEEDSKRKGGRKDRTLFFQGWR